ncbi:hypothetical protein H2199_000938 [Coniosporium tulheliwenetii]|uniref:Uncharacterized protein n=1 Tax=Coniosporium tulheliwenetii TaxID=3383036 RepID=A0ACC2ZN72_9PEZI|nr:hypothetical protein H2199_000938 [Cladosporium sp. JES 115]
MSESQPDHESTIQEFLAFLRSAACEGALGSDPAAKPRFVPIDRITEQFKDIRLLSKLLGALFRDKEHTIYPETIQKDFPRVFCILLSIGKASFIGNFIEDSLSDKRLPFHEEPPHFPIATEAPDFWESFEQKQWMFCPATFKSNTPKLRFGEKLILPIIHKEEIAEGGSAVIHKIQIHSAYNRLKPHSEDLVHRNLNHHLANTFVLKTYRTKHAEKYYDSEVYGFSKLKSGGRSEATIIGFYGSFTQNGTFNVLLEYADMGNLEQYFRNFLPPSKGEDIKSFWSKLFDITRAIQCIHTVEQRDSVSPKIFQGWHQDIKPANILVMSNGQSSPYMYDFKLADLGLSHFRKHVPSEGDALDNDTYGTRTYVWMVHGYPELEEYRQRRKDETGPNFEDSDCFHNGERVLNAVKQTHESLENHVRGSDHITKAVWKSMIREMLVDAQSRPDALQSYKKTRFILEDARKCETTSQSSTSQAPVAAPPSRLPEFPVDRRRSQLTPLHMNEARRTLPPAGPAYQPAPTTRRDRAQTWDPNAVPPTVLRGSDTWRSRLRVLEVVKRGLKMTMTKCPNPFGGRAIARGRASSFLKASHTKEDGRSTRLIPLSAHKQVTRDRLPFLSFTDARKWKDEKKAGRKDAHLPSAHLLERLKGRDHAFLVDNSSSMLNHWPDVVSLLEVLAYIAKRTDDDGLDLYFSMSTGFKNYNNATELVKAARKNAPRASVETKSDMRTSLGSILSNYQIRLESPSSSNRMLKRLSGTPTRKPLSLYILTDGVWQPECSLDNTIKNLVTTLEKVRLDGFQVGLQFVRFGSNKEGTARLNRLDSGLDLPMDIVDTEPFEGCNIWKIFLGATDKWFDDDNLSATKQGRSTRASP